MLLDQDGIPYDEADLAIMSPEFKQELLKLQREELNREEYENAVGELRERRSTKRRKPYAGKPIEPRLYTVYLLSDGQYCRIGMSSGEMDKQIKAMQIANPRDITVLAISRGLDKKASSVIQAELHKKYAQLRLRGEWFELDQDHIQVITQTIATEDTTQKEASLTQ